MGAPLTKSVYFSIKDLVGDVKKGSGVLEGQHGLSTEGVSILERTIHPPALLKLLLAS